MEVCYAYRKIDRASFSKSEIKYYCRSRTSIYQPAFTGVRVDVDPIMSVSEVLTTVKGHAFLFWFNKRELKAY